MGLNSAIRVVERYLDEAKEALGPRERRDGERGPTQQQERTASAFDSQARALVRHEVRAAVSEALAPVLSEVRAKEAGEVAYYSVEKAAAMAEVHPDTIRAWVKAGRLPEHRAGRELRIRRDELHRFLDGAATSDVRPNAEDEAAMILARKRR